MRSIIWKYNIWKINLNIETHLNLGFSVFLMHIHEKSITLAIFKNVFHCVIDNALVQTSKKCVSLCHWYYFFYKFVDFNKLLINILFLVGADTIEPDARAIFKMIDVNKRKHDKIYFFLLCFITLTSTDLVFKCNGGRRRKK